MIVLWMTLLTGGVWAGIEREPAETLSVPLQLPAMGYSLTNAFADLLFDEPVVITSPPGETNRLFIVERKGTIQVITNLAHPTKHLFLDLRATTYSSYGEAGLLGLAFHPGYATNGYLYVYRTRERLTPEALLLLHDELGRFSVSPSDPNRALPQSESVLIAQPDQSEEHNAGDVQFGPDGYLYLSLGDKGPPTTDFATTRQPIDKNLFGGIIRIDVDRRPGNLPPNPHPSVTANYSIPADNPFIGVTEHQGNLVDPQQVRTEFYAIGFRNPWRLAFHPDTGELYCGDVGGGEVEEVNLVRRGGNYGWPYREGTRLTSLSVVAPPGFSSSAPLYSYEHGYATNQGRVIIGGRIYTGPAIPQLQGAYLFGDNVTGHIWALRHEGENLTEFLRLTSDPGVSTFGLDPRDSEMLLANVLDGRIKRLVHIPPEQAGSFPLTLAETGVFSDLETLTPSAGVVPYEINVPFWSDYAIKSRWFAVPELDQTIGFQAENNWSFPEGTVWIKHFELELTNGLASSRRRLETRLLVKNNEGVYGVTYRWGDSTTNAYLLPDHGADETFTIYDQDQVRTQTWHYPTRSECVLCHSGAGGSALGFNTAQLNLDSEPHGNQLELLSGSGYFNDIIPDPTTLRALTHPTNTASPIQERVRSYLSANCSQCHYPGSWTAATWDATFTTPTPLTGLIRGSTFSTPNSMVVPGASGSSVLFQRISHSTFGRMPPISSTELDTNGMALIRQWIDTLPTGPWTNQDVGVIKRYGSVSIESPLVRVGGSGAGIGQMTDSFHFLFRTLNANGEIVARLDEVSMPAGQAGVMVRQNLDPGSAHAALLVSSNTIQFVARTQPDAAATVAEFPNPGGPVWLRLTREGTALTAWSSSDGTDYTRLSSAELPLSEPMWMGLAAASGTDHEMNSALAGDVIALDAVLQANSLVADPTAPAILHLAASVQAPTQDISRVSFYSGDRKIASRSEPPYEVTWNEAWAGLHNLEARVFDRNGVSIVTMPVQIEVDPAPTRVVYDTQDTQSRGDWLGSYGTEGFSLPGIFTNLPINTLVNTRGATTLSWPGLDQNPGALREPFGSGRQAAAWVHPSPWTLQVDLNDGIWHKLGLYFLDDATNRIQTIELIDPATDLVLDTQVVSNFDGGEYVVWNVRGSVEIRITSVVGGPAVLSGLFLDPIDSAPVPVQLTAPSEEATLSGPTSLLLQAEVLGDPSEVRVVEFMDNGTKIGEDSSWPYEYFWAEAWPGIHDLTARSLTHFDALAESTPVRLSITSPETFAVFLNEDRTTRGNWKPVYGQEGVIIAGHATNLPPFAQASVTSDLVFVSADNVTSAKALEHIDDSLRIAASFVANPFLTSQLNLRDGRPHLLAIYLMEWGSDSRTLTVSIRDSANAKLLDQRQISRLSQGAYLTWVVRGHVQLQIRLDIGGNAILNGLFLGPVARPLEPWRAAQFTEGELAQPEISADWADVDLDGLPTLLEYLLGLNPKTPATESPFLVRLQGEDLFLEFDLVPSAWDATYLLEGSPDLNQWVPYPVEEVERIDQPGHQHLLLRATLPLSSTPRYFFRWGAQRR